MRRARSVSTAEGRARAPTASAATSGGNMPRKPFQAVTTATSTSRTAPVATTPRAWKTVPTEAKMAAYVYVLS